MKETASEEEIKAAYRRLSLIYHPDKTGGDSEMYLKIQNAFNTLSDANQRILYDARLRKARSEQSKPRKSEKEIFQRCIRIYAIIIFSLAAIGLWLSEKDYSEKNSQSESHSEVTNVSPYAGNSLETGSAPYPDYYRNQFDYTYDNYIEVRNGNDNDAVVLLSEPITKKVIRNVYIKAGATFRIRNIPQGVYAIKCMSGKDWNPEMQVGKVKGCFEKDLSFSETSANDYFDMRVVVTYDGYSIPTYTLTLYTVRNGNLHMRQLSADQFF